MLQQHNIYDWFQVHVFEYHMFKSNICLYVNNSAWFPYFQIDRIC